MAKLSKKQLKELKDSLALERRTVWSTAAAGQRKEIWALAERYKVFLDKAKTERMAVGQIVRRARAKGFRSARGDGRPRRLIIESHGKIVALAALGRRPVQSGLRLIGTHIDAPRLDLKMHPLYEDQGLAFLKTHYYGGIKKYQWLARPLALHGVVCTADEKTVEIHIGEEADEPVFTLLDVLPHLSRRTQDVKKMGEAVEAERMNLLVAGLPLDAAGEGEKVKLAVLQLLHKRYGIKEADLISAELEAVPAGKTRDVGLDRGLIGAYAQDDRICAFATLEALLAVSRPARACVALFTDKEEVGSEGATSANSLFIEHLTAELLEASGEEASWQAVHRALSRSKAISADVNGAFDPDYPEVHEKRNAAYLGQGISLTKYTGRGGKYGASDANAEYVAWIRRVWDRAKVPWQAAGLGKVDEGGGGTIAKFMAAYGMEVIDAGPALLSMHSPFEIAHKADLWSTVEAFAAFYRAP